MGYSTIINGRLLQYLSRIVMFVFYFVSPLCFLAPFYSVVIAHSQPQNSLLGHLEGDMAAVEGQSSYSLCVVLPHPLTITLFHPSSNVFVSPDPGGGH